MTNVSDELVALTTLDRTALVGRWAAVFRCPAPRNCQARFLRAALAWQLQVEHSGRSRRDTDRWARSLRALGPKVALSPGTRLLREWQGRTHHVTVAVDGFEYDGRSYRSLTAITRAITGMSWSGPKFFGLRS